MGRFKIGDVVARKSYGLDILFKIADIRNNGTEDILTLKGICYRIQADAPESDLVIQPGERVSEQNARMFQAVEMKSRSILAGERSRLSKKAFTRDTSKATALKFQRPGKVLHIDGDSDYMENCLRQYRKFGIDAVGKYVPEKDQPQAVTRHINEYRPDILVLTGHDGLNKDEINYQNLDSYKNSKHYISSVKEARKAIRGMDDLVIFAGACQSMYDGILNAGANYASAPQRVLIHALDPVFVCQKVAYTGIDRVLDPMEVVGNTITGKTGIGGLETRGKFRVGYPKESEVKQ